MKTPAKKATKAIAKAPAKVAAPSKKVSAKSPVKAKTAAGTSKAVPAKAKAAAAPSKPGSAAGKAKSAVSKAKAAPAPAKAVSKAKTPTSKAVPAKKTVTAKKPGAPTAAVSQAKSAPAKAPAKAKPQAVAKPSQAQQQPEAKTPPVAVAQPAPVPAAAPAPSDLPLRSSRPSARLAQITVPSMPQAVASTAAKASFLPSMPTTVLPVPAATIKKDPKLANNWKNKPVAQLTDPEVLAMPDSEYMNDVQMAFFRLKLVQLKQGILNNAGETTEHLREDTVVVPDPADRATIEEEHALELRTRDRERKLLKKIEQSIARIDAGDYGYCDETGEPIGVGRLLARPTATLSLEAQQRRELKQKMFGD